MNLLKKYDSGFGLKNVVNEGEAGMKYAIFDLLKIEKGNRYTGNTQSCESAFVILSGSCNFRGNGFSFDKIGKRKDVFSGKPTTVYLPGGSPYEIEALGELEIGVCSAPSTLKSEPRLIEPEDVAEFDLGVLNWKRKACFIIDQRVNSERLYVGETLISPGKWAFPPHRHDFDNLPEEVDMEEIYHFRVNPSSGFGIQVAYTDDRTRDDAYLVRNGDTTIIPNGYHPVGASPVDNIYFLWFMAGDKRYFLSRPDDDYSWTLMCENLIKSMDK